MNIAVLISGRGSNMLALHQAIQSGNLANVTLVLVIGSRKEAAGLAKASNLGLPAELIDRSKFSSRRDFEDALTQTIRQHPIDLLVLAGFMRVLSADFVARFAPNIINIHPSLLPKYKGLNTHKRVLAAQEKKHGLTIHIVTAGLDRGPIIVQKEIAVATTDTEESLTARLLIQEHLFLTLAVRLLADGEITLTRDGARYQNWKLDRRGIKWTAENHAKMKITRDDMVISVSSETQGSIVSSLPNRNRNLDKEAEQTQEAARELLCRIKKWLLEQDSNLRPIG